MAKTKLRWEFPTTIETIEVQEPQMTVRNCLHGINEQGTIVKTLYCTRDGRFYVHYPDGWHKLKPNFNPSKQISRPNMHGAYPEMTDFGYKHCHSLVAHAWIGARPEGMECDHLNGNKLDWSADNLEWVTPPENRRRAIILRRLRKKAIDPRWVYIPNLKGLFRLTAHALDEFFTLLETRMLNDDSQLTTEALNEHIAETLDTCYTTI